MKKLKTSKYFFYVLHIVLLLNLVYFQTGVAFERENVKNFVTFYFIDGEPVTVPINVRLSLWRLGDPEPDETDGNGAIVTSDADYGGWQQVHNYTPAADGTVGVNLFNATMFPDFPEIFDTNAYLQVEFKYPSEPDSAYRTVDMLHDAPDVIKRLLLVDSLSSLNPVMIRGGTPNNDFILDVNYNSPQFIKLIFGQNAKSLIYDLLSNWFNLNARLNINGFSGVKLTINADATDAETEIFSIRNSSGTTVLHVDEDGDLVGNKLKAKTSLILPSESGTNAPITRHLSVTTANVVTSNISPEYCSNYASIAVTGGVVGDTVIATPLAAAGGIETVTLSWNALVSSADNVLIRACNPTTADINTANTQTWRVDIWGH